MSGTAILLALFVAGAIATAVGTVLLLRAKDTRGKIIGTALATGGAALLLVVIFAAPITVSGASPEPMPGAEQGR